jgi:protein-S-isoprenylcysteine O-methyltransferase Ste14
MVPAAGAILTFDVLALTRGGAPDAVGVFRWFGAVMTCAFYAMVIWCYLRRGPAIATSRSITAHVAAVAATWAPFVLPLLHGPPPGLAQQAASDLLLVTGTTWSLWSLRFLGRNLSVIAQARGVADRGPYRWVRHPLYTGELVSALGVAVAAGGLAAVAAWFGLCALQVYRAMREEQILLRALPGYAAYRRRTAALLPGVF